MADPRDTTSPLDAGHASEPCLDLRTKRTFGDVSFEGEDEDTEPLLSTDCSWCLKTLEAWGPDDRPAGPGDCGSHRSCYSPPPMARADRRGPTPA